MDTKCQICHFHTCPKTQRSQCSFLKKNKKKQLHYMEKWALFGTLIETTQPRTIKKPTRNGLYIQNDRLHVYTPVIYIFWVLHMYIYICMYMFKYIYISHIYIYVCINKYIYNHIYMYVCMNI